MICFKLWEPVYFYNCTDKSGKFLMHPGRFMGFSCNVGNPMTFKVLSAIPNRISVIWLFTEASSSRIL